MKKVDVEFKLNPEQAKRENRAAIELGVSSTRFESKNLLRNRVLRITVCLYIYIYLRHYSHRYGFLSRIL
jgi:hypothetical protein